MYFMARRFFMKKMYCIFISVIVCTFLFLSCGQSKLRESETESEIKFEFESETEDVSIIYTDPGWNKNENSIPFHLPNGQPNRGFPDRYEYFESENGLYPNYKVSSFWVITSVDKFDIDFPYSQYYLEKLCNEYKEEYFSENVLILWSITEPSGSIQNFIDSLDVNGDTLTINTLRFYPSMQTADMQYRLCEIQVKKADIAGVTNFEIIRKNVRHVPESVMVTIRDEYFTKVEAKEFSVKDFGWSNIAEIQYHTLSLTDRLMVLSYHYTGGNADDVVNNIRHLPFIQDVWVGFGATLAILVKEEYYDKFDREGFTLADFKWNNAYAIEYRHPRVITYPWITLVLKTPGTTNAKKAAEHLKTLYFVKDVWDF